MLITREYILNCMSAPEMMVTTKKGRCLTGFLYFIMVCCFLYCSIRFVLCMADGELFFFVWLLGMMACMYIASVGGRHIQEKNSVSRVDNSSVITYVRGFADYVVVDEYDSTDVTVRVSRYEVHVLAKYSGMVQKGMECYVFLNDENVLFALPVSVGEISGIPYDISNTGDIFCPTNLRILGVVKFV